MVDAYVRRLRKFCIENDLTLKKLLTLVVPMEVENLLDGHISKMEKDGKTGGCTQGVMKAVRSWHDFNGVKLNRRIKSRTHLPRLR
jgi:hypothetical protein